MDQSGKTYGPYTPQGNQGGQTTQAAADVAGGSWKDSPFNEGGLATMFTRRR